jgi:ribonuclease P protein component
MFPKKNRVNKKLIEEIFKKGAFINSFGLNLKYFIENSATPPRVSFIVPKTIEKSAVKRNFLKRRGYLILKKHFNKIPNGFLGAFIFNKRKIEKNFLEKIEEDIKTILSKIKKK